MKIAKFKKMDTEYPYETFLDEEVGENFIKMDYGYVRLTEYVEITLVPLNDSSVVDQQLAAIDKAEASLRTKFQVALNNLEHQRQELRAITYVG